MDDHLNALFMLTLLTTTTIHLMVNKRKPRRYAVKPINRLRKEKGIFNNTLQSMLLHDQEGFFKYCRLTPKLFFHLLNMIKPHLVKDQRKRPIHPAQRLVITLHYLAEGCSMQELALSHMVGHSTVCVIIHETTKIIWDVLGPIYLKSPSTEQEWYNVSEGFFKRWNMPNCVGAVDGKHISIQAPYHGGSLFFNYKKHHSIVLMASCDAFYRFTAVDIGAAGSNHDSTVFKESGFGHAVLKNRCQIPPGRCLPNTADTVLPHFFVGDSAFPLTENIMRPYPNENLDERKRIFNYRLSRARRCIENTFGILAQRWRILRKPIVGDVQTCENIALATVVLHNFVQRAEEDIPISERFYCPTGNTEGESEDLPGTQGQEKPRKKPTMRSVGKLGSNNAKASARANRDMLCDYFNSNEGSVNWQLESIMKGSLPDNL